MNVSLFVDAHGVWTAGRPRKMNYASAKEWAGAFGNVCLCTCLVTVRAVTFESYLAATGFNVITDPCVFGMELATAPDGLVIILGRNRIDEIDRYLVDGRGMEAKWFASAPESVYADMP